MLTKAKIIFLGTVSIFFLVGCSGVPTKRLAEVIEARSAVSSVGAEPNNIVLMLPLEGKLADSSKAIRNGFLAAYYHDRKENPGVKIRIVDTSEESIQELYKNIVSDGAEVIVGPLTKREVEGVLNISSLPVPTIALNTLNNYNYDFASNLYQFGLSPQDEVAQIVTKMINDKHDRAAVIIPEGSWGDKIHQRFKDKYEENGGEVVDILRYNNSTSLTEQFCPFLAEDATKLCVRRVHKDKKQDPDEEEPTRRQDINTIFLVANAPIARQIVPLVKFYYAGDLPLYSISTIYSGTSVPNLDQDINGIIFCDAPWVLQNPDSFSSDLRAIHGQIVSLWKDSLVNYPRLYALGIDAYNLASRLNRFLNSPQYGWDAATGKLYLDRYNHIYRELDWARMRNGVPVLLPN